MTARTRIGRSLRRWSDRIDPTNAPRYASPYSFTFERHEGIRLRDDGRGCPLVYMCDVDNDRAHAEADSAEPKLPPLIPEPRLGGRDRP